MSCSDLWQNSCHDAWEKLIFRDCDRNLIISNTVQSKVCTTNKTLANMDRLGFKLPSLLNSILINPNCCSQVLQLNLSHNATFSSHVCECWKIKDLTWQLLRSVCRHMKGAFFVCPYTVWKGQKLPLDNTFWNTKFGFKASDFWTYSPPRIPLPKTSHLW